ncbi:hypothetical protein BH09PLA1_BH09PLA1_37820 [soil metagenome]
MVKPIHTPRRPAGFTLVELPVASKRERAAFTLVELMVVVGIIAVLISVLIPVIASVRTRAYDADSKSWAQQLTAAIERYQADFRAYPGPLTDAQISANPFPAAPFSGLTPMSSATGFDTALTTTQITGAENLVLGLLGGLRVTGTAPTLGLVYDPAIVGLGAQNLNAANPKRFEPYLDSINLSWRQGANGKTGAFQDGTGSANDTIIPEFVDRYPSGEMPILYLRARRGVPPTVGAASATANNIITFGGATRTGTYDLSQIIGYTQTMIGEGKKIKAGEYINAGSLQFPSHGLQTVNPNSTSANPPQSGRVYIYPMDAYAYFESAQIPNTARNKDSFILIAAGPDRVYGTRDDIVNFGAVGE